MKVRWLHLSDFHVGKDAYAQRKLFAEIHDHIRTQLNGGFVPHFIFITGDLANKGKDEEYTEFLEVFLTPLVSALGDEWSGKIFCVPGNHDVQRGRSKYFQPLDVINSDAHPFDPTKEGQLEREQFINRFENYSEYELTNNPKNWISSEQGAFSTTATIDGLSVGIAGINTAWLSKDDTDRHQLTPGVNIVRDTLQTISSSQLKIVLGHHPLDWFSDGEANQVRTYFAKHHVIYLHGHLHEHDARFDDGGTGLFLCVRCGSAFQGRTEDKPKWVNGLMWGEADYENRIVLLQPLQWSSHHSEWKPSADAFPNNRRVGSSDWWQFSIPGPAPSAPKVNLPPISPPKKTALKNEPSIAVRAGWQIVDAEFLAARAAEEPEDQLLQFFDGRPPNWRLAISASVPRRKVVSEIRARFSILEDATKPTVLNLLGAGGEGKSTAFLQVIEALVKEGGWTALWRFNDSQSIDVEAIEQLSKKYKKVVIAIDEAYSAAKWLPVLIIRLGRLKERNVHFLLCSRTIDWRAEADQMGLLTKEADYQEVLLRGLSKEDALQIVQAWAKQGRDGLRNLHGIQPDVAAESLHAASIDPETEQEEGAFLGAMLRLRYGNSLKDKIRSILYRLKDIPAPGGTLLEAYSLIAAMHNEGLRFLSLPVLAEALNCSQNDVQRKIINPLADEAISAGGGRFVLCRHKAIAEVTVPLLNETNLYGEINDVFPQLSRAAVIARHKGLFVPDLHKWNYHLPERFMADGRHTIAISIAEGMQKVDPADIRLRVNLSKIYREADENQKAANLFRGFHDPMTRIAWQEWSTVERRCGETLVATVLSAIALCDIPELLPNTRHFVNSALGGLATNLSTLHKQFGFRSYADALMLTCQLARRIDNFSDAAIEDFHSYAIRSGAKEFPGGELISLLSKMVVAMLPLIKFDEIVQGRIPRSALENFQGLSALLRP